MSSRFIQFWASPRETSCLSARRSPNRLCVQYEVCVVPESGHRFIANCQSSYYVLTGWESRTKLSIGFNSNSNGKNSRVKKSYCNACYIRTVVEGWVKMYVFRARWNMLRVQGNSGAMRCHRMRMKTCYEAQKVLCLRASWERGQRHWNISWVK